jgi:uncharacterized protein (TIGR03083 family)
MDLARAERADLLALLETLTLEQWEAPTLCDAWTVREVVAHVLSYEELSGAELARHFARGLFRLDRVNAAALDAYRDRSPAELLALLRAHLTPAGPITPGLGGAVGLTDALIHQQDVRRPLGLLREVPAERLRHALPVVLFGPPIRGILRVFDVRLVATDLDWSFGRGPEVHGSAEALLMVAAGRRGITGELSGPGRARLARRIDSRAV